MPRTCSHIKLNGQKCGSPALKYHTLCYFHYQWTKRRLARNYSDMKEGWTTLSLPPLETKASIMFAITEIQSELLIGTIDNKTARTLLYAIQLAIQVKATEEDMFPAGSPTACPELQREMSKERYDHHRPPQAVCDSCEKSDTCASPSDCHHTPEQIRELERQHEPERYAQQKAMEEEMQRRLAKADADFKENEARQKPTATASSPVSPCPASPSPASTTPTGDTTTTPNPCHGEQNSAQPCAGVPDERQLVGVLVVEPPSVSPTTNSRPLFRSPSHFACLETKAINEINILRSNS